MKLYKGNIVTCDSKNSIYKYLVEDKGKILFVGNERPGNYKISGSNTIDLGEKALLPSFGDGHLHFSSWALISYRNMQTVIPMRLLYWLSAIQSTAWRKNVSW